MIKLTIIALLVFILNIPFGYWRANVKRFSSQWFLAIHLPVPFIIALRILSGIGFAWYTYLFLVGAFKLELVLDIKLPYLTVLSWARFRIPWKVFSIISRKAH